MLRKDKTNNLTVIQNILRCLIPVILCLAISVAVTTVVMFASLRFSAQGIDGLYDWMVKNGILITGMTEVVCIGVFGLMWQRDLKFRGKTPGTGLSGRKLIDWIWPVLSGFGAALALNIFLNLIRLPEGSAGLSTVEEMLESGSVQVEILVVLILAPIAEELCFRGILFGRLREWLKDWPAIILSALAFGLYHGNLPQFVYAGCLGILLAYVFRAYDNLLAPVLLHIAGNLLIELLDRFGALDQIMERTGLLVLSLAGSVILVAASLLCIRKRRVCVKTDSENAL